ncbi:MAG: M67 family metallopeptidase [Minwuia sp.]|nr:M67 family metallopeptidase [Minwuia sp.]
MSGRRITLPIDAGGAVIRHLHACFPEEGCGLITGRATDEGWEVTQVVPSPNVAETRERTFEIDPGLRLRTQRDARERGEVILGHFHSHPYGDPVPSDTDTRRAADEPDLLWLVIGMRWGGAQGLAAWLPAPAAGSPMQRIDIDVTDGG